MKSKIKKIIVSIVILSVISILSIVLYLSCRYSWFALFPDYVIYQDGYFQYIVIGEHSRFPKDDGKAIVAIVGFTESGKEQEAIDIPREIDGKPVCYIGYNDQAGREYYYVYSENLKKIYIHDNINYITNFLDLNGDSESEVCLMVCSANSDFFVDGIFFENIYFYEDVLTNGKFHASPANIVFMNNYSTEINNGYYRLDNINIGEKIPTPPAPERNGYEFIGWYTESECINVWNFNVSPMINENETFKLYAGWREI